MAANRSLEDGLAILRFIAESDAIRQVRGRIRDGASRVAENDRVPRVIAGSAGILAALLSDTEEPDTDAYPEDLPSYEESSEMQMPSTELDLEEDEEDDDEVPESVATVRDLEGTASLDGPLEEEEQDDTEDEAGVLLPYDAYEVSKHEDLMAEDGPQPHGAGTKPTKPQAKPQAKAETKSASRAKGKKVPSGKKTPTVKATKSANAAKGAARKAAVKRKKPNGNESVPGQGMDTGKSGKPKPADKPVKSKAAKAAKSTKSTKPAQGKPSPKPQKPRVVKRPVEKNATKGDPTGGKKSS